MNGKMFVTAIAMTAGALAVVGCGEIAEPIPDPEPAPITALPDPAPASSAEPTAPASPSPRPEKALTPALEPKTPAEPAKPEPQPAAPEPAIPAPIAGGARAPIAAPCGAGQLVELSIDVSPSPLGPLGPRPEYCTGVVQFSANLATWDASHWNTAKLPWVRVDAVANGRSINPDPHGLVGLVQTSTLVYPDGKKVDEACRFEALCENGMARGVASSW
jgi:hypothetical protein